MRGACASASRLAAKKSMWLTTRATFTTATLPNHLICRYLEVALHYSHERMGKRMLLSWAMESICTASDWSDSSRVVDSVDLFQIKKATTASNPFAAEGAKRWRAHAHPSSTHSTVGSFEIRIEGGSFVWMTRREDDDDDDDDLNRIKQKSSKKRLPSEEWRGVRGVRPRPRPSQLRVPPVENQISISRQDLANLTHALKSNWLEWRFSVGCVYRMEIESFHI